MTFVVGSLLSIIDILAAVLSDYRFNSSIISIEMHFSGNWCTKPFLTFTFIILWVEVNGKVMGHLCTEKEKIVRHC